MKQYTVLTLFPEMIIQAFSHSILARAQKENYISIEAIDIRAFSKNKQKHIDDYPYGGGVGMVMQAQPIYDAYQSIPEQKRGRVIYLSPQGKTFTQKIAQQLAKEENIVFLCGHYEGVDERVLEQLEVEEISIGDFILTGGEIAAITVIDAVARLVPGVLGKEASFQEESFSDGLLEYPQYTRPSVFMGRTVPEVLLSGHHGNIQKWRKEQSILRTKQKRPDLLK
ncbi:tRNA (guanosine(37)-N1)-methyltransferase TrmD [Clostridium sp. MD294]|uniref:tRNA (guanosine(37)-N1)-methyltransferase TrmD n=1 Tax=Clostridium sp. MD294 TaxID=97138 RepID=UPI0002CA5D95|nr:tRNA (guanosine(37)-N1)-methyltransferase TrmD [Clostridium sp. MD294]NDO46796.1 tRNA (guanosine(37)-N1)-methyltransferase TrmD [Clostridium sp. MD294]USF28762.1 tRNA (guanine-N(1)-)-methyltransferase [Clostridium sp. MD294]